MALLSILARSITTNWSTMRERSGKEDKEAKRGKELAASQLITMTRALANIHLTSSFQLVPLPDDLRCVSFENLCPISDVEEAFSLLAAKVFRSRKKRYLLQE